MAKVVKVKSELKSNKNKAFLYTAFSFIFALLFLCVGIGLLVAVLSQKLEISAAYSVIPFAFSLVMMLVTAINRKKHAVLKSGVNGEKSTLQVLKRLPKNYTVITNPVIHNRGSVNELDFAVVCKNGVFIVEAKNYRGIIVGNSSQQSWKQIKYGKNGNTYEKEVKNPLKQAHRQAGRMFELFKDLKITADVYPILYFADANAELRITDDADSNVAVIKGEQALLDYILQTESKRTLKSDDTEKIINIFKN
ncbi:MAG: NERD domain-containing protein [Oscillospiraceae bacterium]|nr:NERD domain-containing protein [Oscillospiraceae bacterium]